MTNRQVSGAHRSISQRARAAGGLALSLAAASLAQLAPEAGAEAPDWKSLETPLLTGHVQLTMRDQFVKAGEAYFSPDGNWIVFQAVPVPEAGNDPDPYYSMYVAALTRDEDEQVTGIAEPILISPPGSANTCGWFDPQNRGRVIFGSTIVPPSRTDKPGFKVGTNKYAWSFPEETEVVSRDVPQVIEQGNNRLKEMLQSHIARKRDELQENERMARAATDDPKARESMKRFTDAKRQKLTDEIENLESALALQNDNAPGRTAPAPLFSREDYDAECSFSPDGRFVLYSHVAARNPDGSADADIWIYDTSTGRQIPIVQAPGYDGGPFFSPDGSMICYRSDRKGDNLLQLFIARLKWDEFRVPVGIEWERPLTDNGHVNWCPFWHPSGKFVVYATSEIGHTNYEVFAAEVSDEFLGGSEPAAAVKRARITSAAGADVLPVFSPDGQWMLWTAQRGPTVPGETRPSSQIWIARVGPGLNAQSLFGAPTVPVANP